ncbi:MAG: hypothetical protein ACREIC_07835, partial [Limisphaerales bacterium]
MNPCNTLFIFLRRTRWLAFCLLLGSVCAVTAQNITQTLTLNPGWNSVFLEVSPPNPAVGLVFSDPSISSVWEPVVRVTTVSFIQNQNEVPFNRGGWAVYVPTNRPESINNNLFSVRPNHAYLVNVSGTQPVQLTLTGQPSVRQLAFEPDAFTLRGFPVDPASPPTFQQFFASSPAHYNAGSGALQRIYRLKNTSSQWEAVSPGDHLNRNEAYWVYTSGSSSFDGPVSVTPSVGDSLNFGATADEKELTLMNSTAHPLAITISGFGAANLPLAYYAVPTNSLLRSWIPFSGNYTLNVPGGATQRLRFGIQRGQMTNDNFGAVLSVSDGAGSVRYVSVLAQRPAPVVGKSGLARGTHQPLDGGGTGIPVE